VVFSSSSQDSNNKEDMALETVIPGNHPYPVLIPPEQRQEISIILIERDMSSIGITELAIR